MFMWVPAHEGVAPNAYADAAAKAYRVAGARGDEERGLGLGRSGSRHAQEGGGGCATRQSFTQSFTYLAHLLPY